MTSPSSPGEGATAEEKIGAITQGSFVRWADDRLAIMIPEQLEIQLVALLKTTEREAWNLAMEKAAKRANLHYEECRSKDLGLCPMIIADEIRALKLPGGEA